MYGIVLCFVQARLALKELEHSPHAANTRWTTAHMHEETMGP